MLAFSTHTSTPSRVVDSKRNQSEKVAESLSQRIYRDPVHNIIPLRDDGAEGRLLIRLIDTSEFQRLRRIKQLGLGL